MTKEQWLLAIAGALIVLGMFVIVTALRRARQREHARVRAEALLDLCDEPAAPEPVYVEDDPWERPFREQPATVREQPAAAPIYEQPVTAPFREQPVMAPARTATAHRYVVTLSDTSGSFGVRPGS